MHDERGDKRLSSARGVGLFAALAGGHRARWAALAAALAALGLGGCSTLGYYGQAVEGHWRLMRARVPVQELIDDAETPAETRAALARAQRARRFAVDALALPDNPSYTTYVDIKREAVTWNVIATQPLSIDAETWCFPVAGCLSYRGYFRRQSAEAYAERLRQQGLDVAVTQAGAYSSLGWFDDPLLSTMLARGEPLVAGVVFHELAHQQLYVKDDSSFNESFASFVERQGVEDWIAHVDRPELLARYRRYQSRRADFLELLGELRSELAALYASDRSDAEKLAGKAAAFAALRDRYGALKERWGGYSGYDGWFEQPLNNARVAGISTYNRWVGAFATLFVDSEQNYARFFRRSAQLAALEPAERQRRLQALLARSEAP